MEKGKKEMEKNVKVINVTEKNVKINNVTAKNVNGKKGN